jgi:hypothetical protein
VRMTPKAYAALGTLISHHPPVVRREEEVVDIDSKGFVQSRCFSVHVGGLLPMALVWDKMLRFLWERLGSVLGRIPSDEG